MNNAVMDMAQEFLSQAIHRMEESTRMVQLALAQLSEEDIWRRSNESSNSIGNQILHLCGNISQYINAGLGGEEDVRERDTEFNTRDGYTKEELCRMLENVVERAKGIIKSCTSQDLLQKRHVQGFHLSGIGIIIHVVEHYSYHVGQIAQGTKLLQNRDLGFYAGMDLNAKNKP